MPGPLAVAASFDPQVAADLGTIKAAEVKAKGNDLIHSPTVEPMRTPLAGRAFETFGEDPLLSARTAVPEIQAIQRQGVIANVKHFAPNSQEGEQGAAPLTGANGSRFVVDAIIDPRTLQETYFPPFEAAVKEADVGAVMCAYGRLNGEYACESKRLLQGVLRDQWGFSGMVLSDYGFALKDTAKALNAGTDLEMPFGLLYNPASVRAALSSGAVSQATIDERVGAYLRMMFKYGVFDRGAYATDDGLIDKPAHASVAQRAAEQGTVLLRNEGGTLPLDAGKLKTLAVIGDVATRYKGGGGSSNVRPFAFVSPLDAIKARAGQGVEVRYDAGTAPAAAAAAARGADAVVVFVDDGATEGSDKPCLRLQCAPVSTASPTGTAGRPDHDAVISAVAAANPRTTVVMLTGGPVLSPWHDEVEAVLEAWYPGQDGGPALARILFGDVDPGGRLPVSFPAKDGDWPTAGNPRQYPGVGLRAEHSEGVFIGYRHYDERGIAPRWAFGHGLSYTSFALSGLRLAPTSKGVAKVYATVKNTGGRTGTTVPQLYLGLPDVSPEVQQPPRALKSFRKLSLKPGESRRVAFVLDERAFQYYDVGAKAWTTKPGCYGVEVGFSSRELPLKGTIGRSATCDGELVLPASKACESRRVVTITLPKRMRRATVAFAGRTATVRRSRGRLRARVVLTGLPARRVTVAIRGRSATGKALKQTRVFRTCAAGKRS